MNGWPTLMPIDPSRPEERMLSPIAEQMLLSVLERPSHHGGERMTLMLRVGVNDSDKDSITVTAYRDNRRPLMWYASVFVTNQPDKHGYWKAEGADLSDVIEKSIGAVPNHVLYPDKYDPPAKRRVIRRKTQPGKRKIVVRRRNAST